MNKNMFFLPFAVAVLSIGATPIRAEEAAIDKGFAEALLKFDAAQHDLVDGNAETTKAIWSHGDGITLSGGHCQTKFYTACLGTGTRSTFAVFAE
jgi:hypothetical protein